MGAPSGAGMDNEGAGYMSLSDEAAVVSSDDDDQQNVCESYLLHEFITKRALPFQTKSTTSANKLNAGWKGKEKAVASKKRKLRAVRPRTTAFYFYFY